MKIKAINNFVAQAICAVLFGFITTSLVYTPIDQALQTSAYSACDEFYKFGSNAHDKCVMISRVQAARREKSYFFPLLAANIAFAGILIRRKQTKWKGIQ